MSSKEFIIGSLIKIANAWVNRKAKKRFSLIIITEAIPYDEFNERIDVSNSVYGNGLYLPETLCSLYFKDEFFKITFDRANELIQLRQNKKN